MPPLRFGLAVARHLWRHGSEYDIVHMASFPVLPRCSRRARSGAGADTSSSSTGSRSGRRTTGGDTRESTIGTIGWLVQQACVVIRTPRIASRGCMRSGSSRPGTPGRRCSCPASTRAGRADAGRGTSIRRSSSTPGATSRRSASTSSSVASHVRAESATRASGSSSTATARRGRTSRSSRAALGLDSSVVLHGRRPEEEVAETIARAACLVTASEREGYGLVVVEAAAHGTPSVVVEGPENAATELVRDGVNGVVSPDASPESLARAIRGSSPSGTALRESTASGSRENAPTLRSTAHSSSSRGLRQRCSGGAEARR